jgi:BMFP domain-containing protein YqiC
MAIMSETVKAVRKSLGDLEKSVVAMEKSLVRSFERLGKIDFRKAAAKLRSTFTFAAREDLRALIAKVDQLEAKLDEVLAGKKSRA